jgi:hypothetical protein
MRGAMQSGWYRRANDAPHIVRRVSGQGGFWLTCAFDHAPCDAANPLSASDWHDFVRAPDPGIVPG